jgi:hypothetical protein
MLVYWLIFCFVGYMAIAHRHTVQINCGKFKHSSALSGALSWFDLTFIVLVLVIGLRHQIGADWGNYLDYIENARWQTLEETLSLNEPAYNFLNWVGVHLYGGIYLVNTVCAVFFVWGLLVFCKNQPRPWLALLVSIPYLVVVVAMGYTRQGIAIGIAMLALNALQQGSIKRYILWLFFAALFHKSAVILLPLPLLFSIKNRWLVFSGVILTSIAAYFLLIANHVRSFEIVYLDANYESSGAFIRIVMNALPAIIFLIYRKRFNLEQSQSRLWTWMSLIAIFFIYVLYASPSSTAVDRVALYWIPIQIFVLSRLPDVLSSSKNSQIYVLGVVAYSAFVLFVWLFFADHAFAWLPYQFYPWVWLWS